MRIAKEKVSSMKFAGTTRMHGNVPVTAKNAAQMRGRTGMKNASGNTRTAGRKGSGKAGSK